MLWLGKLIAQHSSCHHSGVFCLWLWETGVFEDGDKNGAAAALSAALSSCI